MNAPKISQTVVFEKPDSPQVSAALNDLNPGLARSAGENSTHCESTTTVVTPIRPIAPPGSGSSIRPTITPTKIAKKYQACGARPSGGGISATMIATAIGASAFQLTCGGLTADAVPGGVLAGSRSGVVEIPMVWPPSG